MSVYSSILRHNADAADPDSLGNVLTNHLEPPLMTTCILIGQLWP